MKRLLVVPIIVAMVFLTGCATAPQMRTMYTLDTAGNLVQQQVQVPQDNSDLWWQVPLVVGLGILGIYGISELLDDDDPAPRAAAAPTNPLFPVGGQTSWSTDYVQPVYQPL